MLCKYYTTHGATYTAAILGRTIYAIWARAKMHGLPGFETNYWEEHEIEQARKLFGKHGARDGVARAIARSLGRTTPSVIAQLQRSGLKVHDAGAPWTERELRVVRRYYGKETVEEVGRRIGRSGSAVMHQARILGLKRRPPALPWTKEEDQTLTELRKSGKDARSIANRLGRTKVDVTGRIRLLRLQQKEQRAWTDVEERLLRKLQPCLPYPEIARRLDRPVGSVRARIHELGLGKPNTAQPWTARDDARLRKLYPTTTCRELGKMFGRTADAIGLRAGKLGLTKGPAKPWTAEEERKLERLVQKGVKVSVIALQLDRTETAITVRSIRLGLRKRG